jgi:hypothetical protein
MIDDIGALRVLVHRDNNDAAMSFPDRPDPFKTTANKET